VPARRCLPAAVPASGQSPETSAAATGLLAGRGVRWTQLGWLLRERDPCQEPPHPPLLSFCDRVRSVPAARRVTSSYKMQKCVNLAAAWPARCSGALSAFANRLRTGLLALEASQRRNSVCAHQDLVCLGFYFFFFFPEGQLEFCRPFPLFFWFAAPVSHAVSPTMSSLFFPSPHDTRWGEAGGGQGRRWCPLRKRQICRPCVSNCHVR